LTDQLSGSEAAKAIGDPLGTFVGGLAGLLPEGPARTLLYVVVGLCVAAAPFIYRYYLGVLAQGTAPEGSLERQDYDKLRASLVGGNLAARQYAKWHTAFLDWIERFFGDSGMVDRTLFPHAFGLRQPAPLWTARAFDRCLLLAFIYPIATIFLIWGIAGHFGPAEAALGLQPDRHSWWRTFAVVLAVFGGFSIWRAARMVGWKSVAWSGVVGASAGTGMVIGDGFFLAGGFAGGLLYAFTFAGTRAFARAWAGYFAYMFVLLVIMFTFPNAFTSVKEPIDYGRMYIVLVLLALLSSRRSLLFVSPLSVTLRAECAKFLLNTDGKVFSRRYSPS
jgi:hypothetical protein